MPEPLGRPSPPPVPARFRRQVAVILAVVGLVTSVFAAAAAVFGAYAYRAYDFRRHLVASIEEVAPDADELAFERDVTRRFLTGDYEGIDILARELRASRATFATGQWKLTALYQGLAEIDRIEVIEDPTDELIERSKAWVEERPTSITGWLVLAEQHLRQAWLEGGADPEDLEPEEVALVKDHLSKATDALAHVYALEDSCPHTFATELNLAFLDHALRPKARATFEHAIALEPEYQPYYDRYLLPLDPSFGGDSEEWTRAAVAIAEAEGGGVRIARAMWNKPKGSYKQTWGLTWPTVQAGFRELVARHPDSFEAKSTFLYFAFDAGDLDETRRLLDEVGVRMHPDVWRDREQFVGVHQWARFDTVERSRIPMRWFPERAKPGRVR